MRAHQPRTNAGIVGIGLALALLIWTRPAAGQVACSGNGDCATGESCISGECRLACMTDADCAGGTLCLRGGCFPGVTVTYPIDYGLTTGAELPATCDNNAQCTPTFQCSPTQRCQLLQGGNPITCEDGLGGTTSALCPPFPGWSCVSGVCQGPSCATNGVADCQTSFPINTLECLNGRCTTPCTPANAAATCCAGGRRCDTRPQNKCFQWDTGESGVCIRGTGLGRLYAVRLGSTDLTAAQNIVFVSERFTGTDALGSFGEQALRHLRWLATHADGTNAILSARHNLFVLEADNPNDWGRYISSINSIQDRRGSNDQGQFIVVTALTQFSTAIGTPRTRVAIDPVTKAVFLINLEICLDAPSLFGSWPIPDSPLFPVDAVLGPFPRCLQPNVRATGGSRIVLDVGASVIPGFNLTLDDQISDTYDVMQHEFGHFLARIQDEYDNDSPGDLRPYDWFNVVSRHTVSNCDPTFITGDNSSPFDTALCQGSDDGTYVPANACWGPFINTTTLPSTGGDQRIIGLYPGAERVFPQKAMRSQARCIMRENGSDVFCAACREEMMRTQIPNGASQAFRFLDLSGGIQPPAANGLGPLRGITVSPALKREFVTREEPSSGNSILTVVDTDALTLLGTRNLQLPRQNAALPQNIVVDEAGSRLALPSYDLAAPANSGVILFDATQSFASPLPASAFQSVVVPFLVSVPVLSGRNLLAYRERPDGPLGFTGEIVTLDLTATTPTPQFTIPTTRGPLPHLIPTPLVAPGANLIFFPAAPFPGDPYCDAPSCEIWIFDPATSAFLDQALVLDTAGATSPGIRLATLANAGLPDERLVVATETNLVAFSTASIRAGTFTPEAEGPHGVAGPGSSLAAIAYVPDTDQVLIGAKTGELSLLSALVANPGATRQVLTIPGSNPSMEVRDVLVADNTAYVAMAGFAPAPRAGLLAVLDLARAGADRSAFVQPTAATGLSLPSLAIDRDRGVLYSNAIVDSRDRIRNNPMRSPLIRTLRAPPVPTGCP